MKYNKQFDNQQTLYTKIIVDTDRADDIDEDPSAYCLNELGVVEDSGIEVEDMIVIDTPYNTERENYLKYIIDWAFDNYNEYNSEDSPLSFAEWSIQNS